MSEVPQCAICLDDSPVFASLPCCTIPETSTTRFCQRCIEIICERAPGGVGKCPNCRNFIRRTNDGSFEVAQQIDQCCICHQSRTIVVTQGPLLFCDACNLGLNHRLRYECDGCGRYARIPHPMWRYQPTPSEFTTDTWFCHVRCQRQTHWRIHIQDVTDVPAEDAPESWGRREEWIEAIREQRRRERDGGQDTESDIPHQTNALAQRNTVLGAVPTILAQVLVSAFAFYIVKTFVPSASSTTFLSFTFASISTRLFLINRGWM